MRRLVWATMALPAIALGVAACSSGSSTPSSSPASSAPAAVSPGAPSSPPSSPPAAAAGSGGTVVAVHTSNLGMILTDNQGRTVYLFEKDSPTMSNCAGTCASAWPPLTTSGAPQPGTGVTASELGTVTRADHSVEVTYHGHPLYYFSGDHNPGDTNGQGSQAFGAGWYVLNPAGNKIDND